MKATALWLIDNGGVKTVLKTLQYSTFAYLVIIAVISISYPHITSHRYPFASYVFSIGLIGIVFMLRRVTKDRIESRYGIWIICLLYVCIGLIYATTTLHLGIFLFHFTLWMLCYLATGWRQIMLITSGTIGYYLFLRFFVSPMEMEMIWLIFDPCTFLIDAYMGSYVGGKDRQVQALVSQLTSTNELLRKSSLIDPLTDLLKRGSFQQEAEERIVALGSRTGYILFLDIDSFKTVNDTYGHPFGDKVLQGVAEEVKGIVQDKGIAGRFGGEEIFAFIGPCTQEDILGYARELNKRILHRKFYCDTKVVQVSVSIGIAEARQDSLYETLLYEADQAMYIVKSNGKNGSMLWSHSESQAL